MNLPQLSHPFLCRTTCARFVVLVASLTGLFGTAVGIARSNPPVPRVMVTPASTLTIGGTIPSVISALNLQPVDTLPATSNLNLAITLSVNDPVAVAAFVHDLYNPSSPNYRHFLTPSQFASQFCPSVTQYQAVIDYATAQGFTVTATHSNRLVLSVSAPVAKIQSAFNVTMQTYPHPTENRTFYAPSTNPTMTVNAPILGISGLDNYGQPRSRVIHRPPSSQPQAGSGPSGTYLGNDFRNAYVPGTKLNGAGQAVGLLEFDGYALSDIQAYAAEAGRTSIPLQNILIDGSTGQPSGNGGEVEVCLDIEMILAMAPNVNGIYVYMAPNPSPWVDLLSRMANDNVAKQLSCSWGDPSTVTNPAAAQIFQQMAAQGQTFFQAVGDSDAFSGLNNWPGFPDGSPNVVNVGGTTLTTTGPGGAYVSETVWNWGNEFGPTFAGMGTSGGICPPPLVIPAYQQGVNMTLNGGSTTLCNLPDVALTADNIDVFADGSDQEVGGTSCAAPLWAAFTAMVNQQTLQASRPPVGFLNPALYQIGVGGDYAANFHDITTGNNFNGAGLVYDAVVGYDLCSGWGTPTTNLINTLAGTTGSSSLPTTLPGQHPYDITRTALFWFTHPNSINPVCATLSNVVVASGGDLKIGFLDLGTTTYWDDNNVLDAEDAVIEALSFYWKSTSRTGEARGTQSLGYPTSALGHYRKLLTRELIAAMANNALLGTFPTNAFYVSGGVTNYFPATLIEQAGQAAAGTDPLAIQVQTALLHKFNGSGVTNNFFGDWLECSAWKTADLRKYSKDPTTQINCPGLNDSCQTAKVIPGMPFSDTASLPSYDINAYTNTIPNSPCSSVGSNSTSTATNSVTSGIANMAAWVLAPPVAAVNRTFTVQTRGSNIPVLLSVWSGTCDSLAPVTCVAGTSLFQPAQVSFTTDGMSTYYITTQGNGVVGRVKIQVTGF